MKKLMALLLVLILLLPSTSAYANINSNDGNILNLPPFVDFEVTEKKKVDVIVDIGNTSHSLNTINSLINTTLRPQLAAKGLDYNIIVEDTSEGIDHFYFENYYGREGIEGTATQGGIYRYDILTNQLTKVVDISQVDPNKPRNLTAGIHIRNQYYYDINNQFLHDFTYEGQSYDLKRNIPVTERMGYTQRTYFFSNGTNISQYYDNAGWWSAFNGLHYREASRNPLTDAMQYINKRNIPFGIASYYSFIPSVRLAPDGRLYITYYGSNDYSRNTSGLSVINNFRNQNEPVTPISVFNGLDHGLFLKSEVFYYDANHLLLFTPVRSGWTGGISYESWGHAYLYNIHTRAMTRVPQYDNSANPYAQPVKGQFYSYDIDNRLNDGRYLGISREGVFMAESIMHPFQKVSEYPRALEGAHSSAKWFGTFGDYAAITIDHPYYYFSDLYLFSLETYTWTFVTTLQGYSYTTNSGDLYTNHATTASAFYNYPIDYDPKKVLIKDVINKNKHRYDADVYYVRIDDSQVGQINSPKTLSETANLINSQNITFVGIGNATATTSHTKLQSLLNDSGKLITTTNLQQAFNEATSFIINKKDIDLHILQSASSPLTAAQIQTVSNQVRNDLRSSNYIVNIHNVNVTPNNLVNQIQNIKWNDYRNNYVVSFDTSALNELNKEEMISTVASNMNAHYAHYLSYGNSANRVKRQSVFELMNNRGYVSQQTNTTTITNEIKNYIINTAESNPKRHISKLVLKHDPTTDQYSSEINLNAYYFDHEGDRQKAERFKTEHDPTVYENHTGLMANTGVYLNSAITRFTKVGKYEIVAQKQDTPTSNSRFSNYDLWSDDSLSRLVLYVHRQPVAQFQAYFNSSNQFILNDLSYDLDNYSKNGKGILKWDWKYKRTTETTWTYAKPSGLNASYEYIIALRVQDIDEAWSNEYMVYVGRNAAPVAYFEVNPSKASWTSNPTITDLSYSSSGLALTGREWKVYREGRLLLSSTTQPTTAQIKQLATQSFPNAVGTYRVELKVRDSANQWSEPYETTYELINYEPIPLFNIPQPLYRDSLLKIENLTGTRDLDGEVISFNWQFKKDSRSFTNTEPNPQFVIKDRGLGKAAVGKWEVTLTASDTLNKQGKLTKEFYVLNHVPTSSITGDDTANLDDIKIFIGNPQDQDSEDQLSLQSYWKVTKPSGEILTGNQKDYTIQFNQKGKYKVEHWVVDQLEDSSEIYEKEITVLNKPPVADFTMLPNPTYRGIDVDFKSLAYDEDGYITSIRYTAENEQGLISLLSTEQDFIRAFNSVGTVKITQTVVDDDHEEATMTKNLVIQNHRPTVEFVTPKGTSSNPYSFNTLRPTFEWVYADVEHDPQQRIDLHIEERVNNSFRTIYRQELNHTLYQLTPITLEENKLYRATIRVFDGYDWSNYSNTEYFNIVLNRPPVADFDYSPKPVYEGDMISIISKATDPDNDELTYRYRVQSSKGVSNYYTENFNFQSEYLTYTITQTVTDTKGASDSITKVIEVLPLTITGAVSHTNEWRNIHLKIGNTLDKFYSGEKFILSAATTNYPINYVEVEFNGMQVNNINLNETIRLQGGVTSWRGEYFKESMSKSETFLKNGIATFNFTVQYSNGTIKSDRVDVNIIGNVFDVQNYGRTQ